MIERDSAGCWPPRVPSDLTPDALDRPTWLSALASWSLSPQASDRDNATNPSVAAAAKQDFKAPTPTRQASLEVSISKPRSLDFILDQAADRTRTADAMAATYDFSGKRVLVTGAGQGIGRGLVAALVAAKAEVIAVSKTRANLDSLAAELGAAASSLKTVAVNLGDWDATRAALADVGPVDCLVNNAAVAVIEDFLEMSREGLELTIDVNLMSVINVSQIIAKGMVERGKGGCIVNISSQASMAALRGHTAYAASKAGVDMVTKVMALELGKYNIRVNNVNPTVVLTEMSKGWLDPARGGPMLAKIPLGRFAEVEEVIAAILFLLSDNASMINAVSLPVDGGFLST